MNTSWVATADKLERKARSGELSVLTPRTENVLRVYAAAPTHDDFQKAFCKKRREEQCDSRDHARVHQLHHAGKLGDKRHSGKEPSRHVTSPGHSQGQ